MKKNYEIPEIKIITFRSDDIISTSTGAALALNDVEAINGSAINWN